MNISISLLIIFFSSFLFQFLIISFIKSNKISDINFNLGKLYLSLIFSLFMTMSQIFIYNLSNNNFNQYIYLFLIIFIIVLIILYKYQFNINDKQYINEIIEENSNSILISEKIKNKTTNKEIKDISNNIIKFNIKINEDLKNIIKDKEIINNIIKSES
jgi:Ca2+/Na+ antiporter